MKVLAVERLTGCWPQVAAVALECGEVAPPSCLPVTLMTDNAIVRRGMPMFVPDFALGWELEIVPCFTVGRLGKSIPARFASRYIEGMGIAVRLVPFGNDDENVLAAGALAVNFDGAVAPGNLFPFEEGCAFEIEATGVGNLTIRWDEMHVEEALALISRYMMVKTGDILLPCRTRLRMPVSLDSRVECRLNGLAAVSLKIK